MNAAPTFVKPILNVSAFLKAKKKSFPDRWRYETRRIVNKFMRLEHRLESVEENLRLVRSIISLCAVGGADFALASGLLSAVHKNIEQLGRELIRAGVITEAELNPTSVHLFDQVIDRATES